MLKMMLQDINETLSSLHPEASFLDESMYDDFKQTQEEIELEIKLNEEIEP